MIITIPTITAAELADEEAFNSRFGAIATGFNTGFDADNIPDGAVTRAKIAPGAVTQVKIDSTVTWQTPVYAGNWADWTDAAYGGLNYTKDARGTVHFKGLFRNTAGATGTIFTLPVGYRPARQQLFLTMSNNALCRIDVLANGSVVWNAGPATTNWISMTGITFKAVQ